MRLGALSLLLLAVAPAAVAARAPAPAVSEDDRFSPAARAFLDQYLAIMARQQDDQQALQAAFGSIRFTDRTAARAAIERLRPVIKQLTAQLGRTRVDLLALKPVPFPAGSGVDAATLVADGVRVADGSIAAMTALERGLAAALAGQTAVADASMAEAQRSVVSMIDGMVAVFRARQATIEPSDSAHQSLGLQVVLVRSLAVMTRLRFEPSGNSASYGADFRKLGAEARTLTATGRANLASERAELAGLSGAARTSLAAVYAEEANGFALGDELAKRLDTVAASPTAAAAAVNARQLLGPFEAAFAELAQRQSAAALAALDAVEKEGN